MTNAEKYLKDGVSVEELAKEVELYIAEEYPTSFIFPKSIENYFKAEAKPTLTEDERVILRNININEYNYIARNEQGSLFLVYKSQQVRGLSCTSYIFGQIFGTNLFQFIKERRRI